MTLREAHARGVAAAKRKFGTALAPTHGTARHYYPAVDRPQQDPDMPEWLWNLFGDNQHVSGSGEEVIG